MTERTFPVAKNDLERAILNHVARGEWFVALVPPEGGAPGWAFSIGLFENFEMPEVVICGLPLEVMHQLVNTAGELAREGELADGLRTDALLDSLECAFQPVDKAWYQPLLGAAMWFYGGEDFPALQCLWPDREGRLPTEAGFEPALLERQPDLATADPEKARMESILATLG